MIRRGASYTYEARAMVQYILEGHNEQETSEEFDVSRETVRRRLKTLGYTYEDLANFRDKSNHSKKKNS